LERGEAAPGFSAANDMMLIGYIILVLGLVLALYGEVRFLVVAYNRSLWWFFGCLFVPFVSWFFLFFNLKAAIRPFALSVAGLLAAGLGCLATGEVSPF